MGQSSGSAPKYIQVCEVLRHRIRRDWQPGDRLPSQAALMTQFEASYSTITRALSELRREGLVYARQGQGTFVARVQPRQEPARASLGVMVHLSNWPFMDRILTSFYRAAGVAGYSVIQPQRPGMDFQKVVSAQRHAEVEAARAKELVDRGVAGVLMTSFDTRRPRSADYMVEAGISVVFPEAIESPAVNCVAIDDVAAGEQMTRHLLEQGFERIAFVGSRDEVSTLYGSRRLAGFEKVMGQAGLEAEFFEMPGLARAGSAFRDLTQSQRMCQALVERFDAVLTWTDHVAITLVTSLHLAGFRVPQDLAIVGFNDSPLCEEPSIDLTSLRQPTEAIGREAFAILRGKIEGGIAVSEAVRVTPPFELIVRGSSRNAETAQAVKRRAKAVPVV